MTKAVPKRIKTEAGTCSHCNGYKPDIRAIHTSSGELRICGACFKEVAEYFARRLRGPSRN